MANVPMDHISAADAFEELVELDTKSRQLREQWRADGMPFDMALTADEWTQLNNGEAVSKAAGASSLSELMIRQEQLLAELVNAVSSRACGLVAIAVANDGSRAEFTKSEWQNPLAPLGLQRGRVVGFGSPKFQNAILVFERSKWDAWVAQTQSNCRGENSAGNRADADCQEVMAWMIEEKARRVGAGEDHRRPAMVIATKARFPHLRERSVRKLYKSLPSELKRRGRKKGQIGTD